MRIRSSLGEVILSCSALLQELNVRGIAKISDGTVEELESFVFGLAVPYSHPHEGRPGVTTIKPATDNAASNYRGFTRAGLGLHTDRSCAERPPAILATILRRSSGSGGEALVKDGLELVARLNSAGFGWKDLAAVRLEGCQPEVPFFSMEANRVRIRYRDDGIATPICNKPALLKAIRKELDQPQILRLGDGDGYIVHNHRFLHGRTKFDGDREAVRLLLDVDSTSEFHKLNIGFDSQAFESEDQRRL